MKTNITIPESIKTQRIIEFRINPASRSIVAVIQKDDMTVKQQVNVSAIFEEATATQKTVIRGFFKKMGLQAFIDLNTNLTTPLVISDLDGDVFEEPTDSTQV